MGKKGYKSTWRDPSLWEGQLPLRSSAGAHHSRSSQSFSSESTVAGARRDLPRPRRAKIQDKNALRGTSRLDYSNSKPEERHAPWDEVSDEEQENQHANGAGQVSPPPKIAVLSRSNLKAHEDENVESTGPVEYQPAVSVSDLIELESQHYEDNLEDDLTAQKYAEDQLFDSNDIEPSEYRAGQSTSDNVAEDDAYAGKPASHVTSDQDDIPHTQHTRQHYAQPFFEQSVPDEEIGPESHRSELASNGRSSTFEDRNLDVTIKTTQEVTRAHPPRGAMSHTIVSQITPKAAYLAQQPQQDVVDQIPPWRSNRQAERAVSGTTGFQVNPHAATFSMVRAPDGQFAQIETDEMKWRCENDASAERPQIGRPNTKVLVFAVPVSRDNRRGELDLFSVHSHLIRLFWPLMVMTAHRNEYVRSDGSFLVDSDSIVAKEFSVFVHWLYTGKLLNEDNEPPSSGQLIRLYKFAVREDLPFLRDEVMSALFRFARAHADWKPSPVLFDKFPSDSMICKFVAVTWANHAKELQGVDINKMIQASTKGPAPIIEFMRMAWAEANVGSNPDALRRSPCDFHEHPEIVRQEEDAPAKLLWDWL